MAITFTKVQQLGGWEYDANQRAVACQMLVNDDGDAIPIADLGLRRVKAMYLMASDVTGATVRLLGREVVGPPVTALYSYTLDGTQTAPTIKILDNGVGMTSVDENIDVIFVGEV